MWSAKGMVKMFECLDIFSRKQRGITGPMSDELRIKLAMPPVYKGKNVPPSVVLMELLWQQYGLDLLHPEVSRWLEQNAPDVKYASAQNQVTDEDEIDQFVVGPQGTVELQFPLEIDDRLRAVSSQYILSHIPTFEPETEPQLAA
jgi:hypothetical protein